MQYSLYASKNQLVNINNIFQGEYPRVLFICSAGLLRSATAAHIFSAPPYNWNTRTAGIDHAYALNPVSEGLLCWADHVFVMEQTHQRHVESLFQDSRFITKIRQKIQVLDIPDNYEYRDPILIELLTHTVRLPHREKN